MYFFVYQIKGYPWRLSCSYSKREIAYEVRDEILKIAIDVMDVFYISSRVELESLMKIGVY